MRTAAIILLTLVFSFNVAWAQDGEAPLPNSADRVDSQLEELPGGGY